MNSRDRLYTLRYCAPTGREGPRRAREAGYHISVRIHTTPPYPLTCVCVHSPRTFSRKSTSHARPSSRLTISFLLPLSLVLSPPLAFSLRFHHPLMHPPPSFPHSTQCQPASPLEIRPSSPKCTQPPADSRSSLPASACTTSRSPAAPWAGTATVRLPASAGSTRIISRVLREFPPLALVFLISLPLAQI